MNETARELKRKYGWGKIISIKERAKKLMTKSECMIVPHYSGPGMGDKITKPPTCLCLSIRFLRIQRLQREIVDNTWASPRKKNQQLTRNNLRVVFFSFGNFVAFFFQTEILAALLIRKFIEKYVMHEFFSANRLKPNNCINIWWRQKWKRKIWANQSRGAARPFIKFIGISEKIERLVID